MHLIAASAMYFRNIFILYGKLQKQPTSSTDNLTFYLIKKGKSNMKNVKIR